MTTADWKREVEAEIRRLGARGEIATLQEYLEELEEERRCAVEHLAAIRLDIEETRAQLDAAERRERG